MGDENKKNEHEKPFPSEKPKKVQGEITMTAGNKAITLPLPKEVED